MTARYYCAYCGLERLARRCSCAGSHTDVSRLKAMADAHRRAAALNPAEAAVNLADAERLERQAQAIKPLSWGR